MASGGGVDSPRWRHKVGFIVEQTRSCWDTSGSLSHSSSAVRGSATAGKFPGLLQFLQGESARFSSYSHFSSFVGSHRCCECSAGAGSTEARLGKWPQMSGLVANLRLGSLAGKAQSPVFWCRGGRQQARPCDCSDRWCPGQTSCGIWRRQAGISKAGGGSRGSSGVLEDL